MSFKYYARANTADGLIDLTKENIFDIDRKICLKGENNGVKTLFLYTISELWGDIVDEQIVSLGMCDVLEGLICRKKGISITSCEDGEEIIDIDAIFGKPVYEPEVKDLRECMYASYSDAKKIHDYWEKIYIQNMDFERLNKYIKGIKNEILGDEKSVYGNKKTYTRFFGTVGVSKNTNYIDNLTEGLYKRYFIKGRPGTGKSTFLKDFNNDCKERGFDTEVYLCGFDKNSLDMVVVRELSLCIFDSTSPHERFPERKGDIILDFYKESGLTGVDEKYEKELFDIKNSYNIKIAEGKDMFRKISELTDLVDKKSMQKADLDNILLLAKKIL